MAEGQLSIDVYQNESEIILIAPIAGTSLKEINVSITDEVLTISGTRKFPLKNVDHENVLTQECYWGDFSRSIVLPTNIDKKSIKASFVNSILEIRIAKTEEETTKVIPINSK